MINPKNSKSLTLLICSVYMHLFTCTYSVYIHMLCLHAPVYIHLSTCTCLHALPTCSVYMHLLLICSVYMFCECWVYIHSAGLHNFQNPVCMAVFFIHALCACGRSMWCVQCCLTTVTHYKYLCLPL